MPGLPHRIRRQRWSIQVSSATAAFALRKHLREGWQEVLLPAFEKVFDEEAAGENVVHIPRLELALRIDSDEHLNARCLGLIREQLLAQLGRVLRARGSARRGTTEYKPSTTEHHRFQNLLHYLRSGSVTWEAAGVPAREMEADLKETCLERWVDLAALLQAGPPAPVSFCFRLLQLLPVAEAGSLLPPLVAGVSLRAQISALEILAALLSSGQKHFGRYAQLQLTALFLSEALTARSHRVSPDFARIARRALPVGNSALADFIASLPPSAAGAARISVSTEASSATCSSELATALQKKESQPRSIASIPTVEANGTPDSVSNETGLADNEINLGIGKSVAPVSSNAPGALEGSKSQAASLPAMLPCLSRAAAEMDFSLLATHAGLILLHPFLPRFFETTHVELSAGGLPRAAALLHFLATGEDVVYEYDLVFIKVLLAIGPETPLCVSEGLVTDGDMQEMDALLQSAVTHWTTLKTTSIASFRSSFLSRRALLREDDAGWRVRVERQPFDVLLDHLPWSFGVVKLPWLKRPIYTEW